MRINQETVQKIAKLARLKIEDAKAEAMETDLNQILTWIEQLDQVTTDSVEPMFAVNLDKMPERADIINDGDQAEKIVQNAPEAEFNMFVVPKVVE